MQKLHFLYISLLIICLFNTIKPHYDFVHSCQKASCPQKVAVIGTGYVGLIIGSGLATIGHQVICSDIDENKINKLKNGKMPIFEPGLEQIVAKNATAKRLSFTNNVPLAIRNSDIIIVAVGTPMGENGKANLKALKAVAKTISQNLNGYKVICIKSTVPVGTNKKMKAFFEKCIQNNNVDLDLVSNPEFLRAGAALKDLFQLNPIVLGSDSEKALDIMAELYDPLVKNGNSLIRTNFETAETIKYAWNSLVALKVSYVNDLSRFCKAYGADIFKVVEGMSFQDLVLPFKNVKPGPGLGGSCLPKDTRAFIAMAKAQRVDLTMIKATIESSNLQQESIISDLYNLLGNSVAGKTIAILGLSFKANTDDIRKSPAIPVIKKLLEDGAVVKAYDPQAIENMRKLFPDVHYCKSAQEATKGSDAIVFLTAWNEFKNLNSGLVHKSIKKPKIVDARNIFDPEMLKNHGFEFSNLGKM